MNISDQQWFGDRNCYGFLVSAVCVSPTNGWSFDPLFRVMPRPTMTLDSETHCCGPRVKMWWPWCWIWTCGLFSGDNPTPTIVVVPSNADNVKFWVIFTIKIIKSRVFSSTNTGISPWKSWKTRTESTIGMIFQFTRIETAKSRILWVIDGMRQVDAGW